MIEAGEVEPLIIVGIANTGEHRLAEYTPTRDWKMGGGDADKYGDLLAQDLLPFIAANYRVRSGVENTGLGGSSLGGLVTLYLGLSYPNVYGKSASCLLRSGGTTNPSSATSMRTRRRYITILASGWTWATPRDAVPWPTQICWSAGSRPAAGDRN